MGMPDIAGPLRVSGYFRVSTTRQAEIELSIPDQRRQAIAYCERRGWIFCDEFVDHVTGTNDDRRNFQKMIDQACQEGRPTDVILVHSLSRFFRGAFELEMYVRQLAKYGVRLASITQDLGDDPNQIMMRQIIALFDEHQSRENGKHVLRAMQENARQGYYNGSPLPLGYTTEAVEKRGIRIKKKVIIDSAEAEVVRLIFQLYRLGDGRSGPLGLKATATWLNDHDYRTRRGARFGQGTIHSIITNPIYAGQWIFNKRCAKTQIEKPQSEHVVVDVPAIISRSDFETVALTLKSRDPRVTPPRVTTGPVLLSGLAHCASCSGAMTMGTGTGKSGRVYKYYKCSATAKGKATCKGRSTPMDKLDRLVTDHLAARLFAPERLMAILASVSARRADEARNIDARAATFQTQLSEAEEKLRRLYRMVSDGITEIDDVLKDELASLKLDRDRSKAALDRMRSVTSIQPNISHEAIDKFGRSMRENITTGDIPGRKAYIQAVVDRIEVDDGIVRIFGNKSTLEQAIAGREVRSASVRGFERKWRAQGESNPCFRRERATSWTARRWARMGRAGDRDGGTYRGADPAAQGRKSARVFPLAGLPKPAATRAYRHSSTLTDLR